MKDWAELVAIVLLIIVAVLGTVLLATIPFAIIGWAMSAIVGMFTVVSTSYFDCVAIGIGIAIIAKLISQAKPKGQA